MTLSTRFEWNGTLVLMGDLSLPVGPFDPFAAPTLDLSRSAVELRAVRGSRLDRVTRIPQKTVVISDDLAVSWQGSRPLAEKALRALEGLVARERPSAESIERALSEALGDQPSDLALLGLWGDDAATRPWERGTVLRPPLEELGHPVLAGSSTTHALRDLANLAARSHNPHSRTTSASFVGARTSAALALYELCTAGPVDELPCGFDVVVPTEREGRWPLRKLDGVSALYLTCDRRSGGEPRFVPQRAVQYASVGDDWMMLVASFGEEGIAWEGFAMEHPLRAPRSEDAIRARLWELPRTTTYSCICAGVFDDQGYRGPYTLTTSVGAVAKPDATRISRGDDGVLSLVLAEQDRAQLERIRARGIGSS